MSDAAKIPGVGERLSDFLDEGSPFVSYRLPGAEKAFAFVVGDSALFSVNRFNPDEYKKSFIVAAFDVTKKAVALSPLDDIYALNFGPYSSGSRQKLYDYELPAEESLVRNEYSSGYRIIEEALTRKMVDKVVLARRLEVTDLPSHLLPVVFEQLCQLYPNSFTYFIDHPETGRWMGASPETFLEKSGNHIQTVSLAATRRSDEHTEDWEMKELEEQGLVSVFVDEVLKKFEITDYQKNGPLPVRAGAMIHLRTTYSFEAHSIRNTGKFMEALHPTPAVGGVPKQLALKLIEKAEGFDRDLYSGFLGPVNKGDFHFFVNIRCMQLGENNAVLYLGGGITRDSEEESEWEETRLKARTLLSVLNSVKQTYYNESIHLR